ncbi:NAD-dependent epimerase/dehydratase family protein [Ramlibacter sp.]|uniref:NAD-dependent epimerase/dehydratase family protein n=1 Tax=Ramlibacter sp. TaxID=1917967 RepID=UPI002D710B97|nr:NAD-dependent epimerase/dehydratase family protein [Ramlibacter sp.]HYD76332.1 NAD-dependent epimerase/dehydratase family protein [Ramlibacter sp.]
MNKPLRTVLILGATGRFGAAAVRAFDAAGWRVLAQHRRPLRAAGAAAGNVQWLQADLADPAALATRAAGVDVVVHAMNPAAYTDAAWRAEAPGMMRAAIDIARRLDALLLFPGNVYNFGAAMPALLHEDTPRQPSTLKGALRVELEEQLAQAHAASGLRSVVIRAGDFFGSGHGSLLDRVLAKDLRRGRIALPGARDVATPWAYLPDLARTFERVARHHERLDGAQVLHFAGHALTGQDWCDALEAVAHEAGWLRPGQAAKVSSLPWPLIRAAGLLVPTWSSLAQMRYLWTTPHRLANERLEALIGPEPHTPLPQAVRQALGDLGWPVEPIPAQRGLRPRSAQ